MKRQQRPKEEIKGTPEFLEKYFPIVYASELSLDDYFLEFVPRTYEEVKFKRELICAIREGAEDFRAQRIDPYIVGNSICYEYGKKQMCYEWKSCLWWNEVAKKFLPKKKSRIGNTKQRVLFLGTILKYLIEEEGKPVCDAWYQLCNESSNLANYKDTKNAQDDINSTGSRPIGNWCDLGNTWKITQNNDCSYVLNGGCYEFDGDFFPLTNKAIIRKPEETQFYSCGWLVLNL